MDKTNNLIIIGGIGEPKWQSNNKKTWNQGYRVYDSEGIATTISAMGHRWT